MAESEGASTYSTTRLSAIILIGMVGILFLYAAVTPNLFGLAFWNRAKVQTASSIYAKEHGLSEHEVSAAIHGLSRTSDEANVAYEALRVADSLTATQVVRHNVVNGFSQRLFEPYRAIHLFLIATIGLLGIRRAGRRRGTGAAKASMLLVWVSYITGTIGFAVGLWLLFLSPHSVPGLAFLMFLGLICSVPVLAIPFVMSRGPMHRSKPTSEFGKLAFQPLPYFTLRGKAMGLTYHEENAFPVEGGGPSKISFVDSIIFVVDEKHFDDVSMFRCSLESDDRTLLLIERNLGFLCRVWCLVDVTRPGNSNDLVVRLHRLTPRNLDWMDYTGLRFLAFPVVMALSVLSAVSAASGGGSGESTGAWASGSRSLTLMAIGAGASVLVALVAAVVRSSSIQDMWPLFLMCFVPFVVVSFILYALEAKQPTRKVARVSSELFNTVTQAVNLAIKPILLRD